MKTFNYIITDELGIHARPAGTLVKEAKAFKSDITVAYGDKTADLKKLFAILGLGIRCGAEITFTITGEDEDECAVVLEKFMKENL
jgi:phosphocarrier protein